MNISLQNRQRKFPIDPKKIKQWTRQILSMQKMNQGELGLVFVNNHRIRVYNRTYRGIDRATDVLAFSMREGPGGDLHPQVLGDVMISLEMVATEALLYERTREEQLIILLIHGILHLLGYDHTQSLAEAKRMERREKWLLTRIYGSSEG